MFTRRSHDPQGARVGLALWAGALAIQTLLIAGYTALVALLWTRIIFLTATVGAIAGVWAFGRIRHAGWKMAKESTLPVFLAHIELSFQDQTSRFRAFLPDNGQPALDLILFWGATLDNNGDTLPVIAAPVGERDMRRMIATEARCRYRLRRDMDDEDEADLVINLRDLEKFLSVRQVRSLMRELEDMPRVEEDVS